MRKRLRTLVLSLASLFLLAALVLWFFENQFLFHQKAYRAEILEHVGQQDGRHIEVVTSQGKQVAFYRPSRVGDPARPAFLWFIFPGRASLALDFWGYASRWDERFAYVFVDYPGYGCCEGQPSADHIAESLSAIAQQVRRDLGWSEQDLRERSGVLGHSLGCAAALMLADQWKLKRAVLCAPFSSLQGMALRTVGWPLCCLAGHEFDNEQRLASLAHEDTQVRIFHGTADSTIPFQMSQTLAARFPKSVSLTLVPGCGHGALVAQKEKEIGQSLLELAGLDNVVSFRTTKP